MFIVMNNEQKKHQQFTVFYFLQKRNSVYCYKFVFIYLCNGQNPKRIRNSNSY
jgi:hypothetical protein